MIWQFVADVHGADEKLVNLIDKNLPLALLGDNLNLVDFHTLSGIAARVLSKMDIGRILMNLGVGGPKKAMKLANEIFFHNPEKVAKAKIEIKKDYMKLASVLPEQTIVLHGNVDWPDILKDAMGKKYIKAETRVINNIRIGFLSGTGSYAYSMKLPGEASDKDYEKALLSLGPVDVLCTHFPPDIDDLTWDTVAKRSEGGGAMLLEYIKDTRPALHMFGHIHNPAVASMQFGETRLLNVGGFRYNNQIHHIDMSSMESICKF